MADFDIFNGDADGICSLLQLRLAEPREATLVTGVKRDINLLAKISPATGDSLSVLDISMEKNRTALTQALDIGAQVIYFDHHHPGEIPAHENLNAIIDTSAETCTGLLVNNYLNSAYLAWAVTAAFGDNLHNTARHAALPLKLSDNQLLQLEELGTLLNYNGYGATVDDLFFAPDELFRTLLPYASPFDFIRENTAFSKLKNGFASDMQNARAIQAQTATTDCAMFVFPQASWSRRVGGVYGNELAREYPDRAHALLSAISADTYQVSVRAPLNRREGADELCRKFATGGGRKAAAGINVLPHADIDLFQQEFTAQFRTTA
ncbi:acetyltransferase [Chromatiales bacterium (ex Bugula neritina AB1)]|nr:acetyltransferase [Chromatiales bacterium (ex Bugula neritina AB1)]